MRPVQEIDSLRGERHRFADINLSATSSDFFFHLRGDNLEIVAEIYPASAEECGIKVRCSPNSEEETYIF